ncbi:MAG: hypothetical protein HYY52_06395 [Candidatus Melainabacteria bacterium]|nr:hypothetical protein [Candidatus Melainabacteria bacterium]
MSVISIRSVTKVLPSCDVPGQCIDRGQLAQMVKDSLGVRSYLRFLPTKGGKRFRELYKELPENININGPKQKFIVKSNAPGSSSKQHYDPAVELGVAALRKLVTGKKVDLEQVDSLYVASTTARAGDPTLSKRILSKLQKEGITSKNKDISREILEGWHNETISEGCVGWLKTLERANDRMELGKSKTAIILAIAVNSIYRDPRKFYEQINYADGCAATVVSKEEEPQGKICFAKERNIIDEEDRVVHNYSNPPDETNLDKIYKLFTLDINGYLRSKEIAKLIAEHCAEYTLSELLENLPVSINSLDHLFFPQINNGFLDKIEINIFLHIRDEIGLTKDIRSELKPLIDNYCKDLINTKKVDIIEPCRCFFNVIKAREKDLRGEKEFLFNQFYKSLTDKEKDLFDFMSHFHKINFLSYDEFGYTGVASIPLGIAHAKENTNFDLHLSPYGIVSATLGINICGAVGNPFEAYSRKPFLDLINHSYHRQEEEVIPNVGDPVQNLLKRNLAFCQTKFTKI